MKEILERTVPVKLSRKDGYYITDDGQTKVKRMNDGWDAFHWNQDRMRWVKCPLYHSRTLSEMKDQLTRHNIEIYVA